MKMIRKLSTDINNYLQRPLSLRGENMKFEKCPNGNGLDEYIVNELGFDVLVKYPNEKKKEVVRY